MAYEKSVKIAAIVLATLLLLGGGCAACAYITRTTQDAAAPH